MKKMYPDQVPVFSKGDILISELEYEEGNKKTSVGWLKELFLYRKLDKSHIAIWPEDRQIFAKVLDKFCRLNTIKVYQLHDWEEKTSPVQQARLLNKLMRSLGYNKIEEI